MSENGIKVCPVSCKIEHHAMMFAFLAKLPMEMSGVPAWRQMHSHTVMN